MDHRWVRFASLCFLCASCPHRFSCTLFIHCWVEYFSHIRSEVLQSSVYLLVSASCLFSEGYEFAQDSRHWGMAVSVGFLFLVWCCAQRSPGTKLSPWETELFLLRTQAYILKTTSCRVSVLFLCRGKLHWHQRSYLWNKEVSEWSQCFRGLLLKKLPAAIGKTSLSLSICQWNWKESLEGERELALWWWSQRAAISKVAAPSHLTTCREMPVSFLGGSLTLLLSFWEWTIVLTKGATSFYKVMEKEKQNSLLILQIKPHC